MLRIVLALTMLVVLTLRLQAPLAAAEEESKKTPFQEMATSLLAGGLMHLMEYGHLPHFTSWQRMQGDVDDNFRKRCRRFSDDLIAVLGKRGNADHESAILGLAIYTSYARYHATRLSEKDVARAVERALAPHTGKIRQGLGAGLQDKSPEIRLLAALALLNLDEKDARANEVLKACADSAEEPPPAFSSLLGVARVTSPQAIEYLRTLLKHRKANVRQEAAGAIITMGPAAGELTRDLIAFLETGDNARGEYYYPLSIGLSQKGNLALMALESLQQHAQPAVPSLLARFPKAADEEQLEILACLASIGCKDDACLVPVRKALESDKTKLKLTAACTLLHLVPDEPRAVHLVKKALNDESTRELMFEVCQQTGPPSRAVVKSLLPFLESKKEEVRISATRALARIGASAEEAVPALEKLLSKKEDSRLGTDTTHTFVSMGSAAYALSKIRGKAAAAALLRVANKECEGAYYATQFLPELGDDLPPTTVAVLRNALRSKQRKFMAAIALSNLGERARPARPDLERLLDDPHIGWIVDTALRRIPANPADSR